jgi:hypothetical protein
MKTANYFPLLANHYASTKSLNIRRKHGLNGYAIFIIMLQKLAATTTRSIRLDQIEELAFELHLEQKVGELRELIKTYFDIEGDVFYSQELNDSLAWYDEKYNKSSLGGKKAAENMTPEQRKERSRVANEEKNKKRILSNSEQSIILNSPNGLGNGLEKGLTTLASLPNNRIEKNIKEENYMEQKEIVVIPSEDKNIEPGFFHSPIVVKDSMDTYLKNPSNFFFPDNQNIVTNSYCDFYNQYPKTELTIYKFEKILYFYLLHMTMSMDLKGLNDYISTHPITVQPVDIFNSANLISNKPEVKECYEKIIKEINANVNDIR